MRKALFLLILIVAGSACAVESAHRASNAQANTPTPSPEFKPFGVGRIVREGGWTLPDFKKIVSIERRQLRIREGAEGSGKKIETYEIDLELNRRHIITLDEYVVPAPHHITLTPQNWLIENMQRFEVDGRPFCYMLYGVLVGGGPSGELTTYMRGHRFAYYYDDGDSYFETLQLGGTPVPRLPNWVLKREK